MFMKKAGSAVPSANRITLLRDADGDGVAEIRSIFLDGLNSPFGMELVGDDFYVANTDAILRYPYQAGQTRITVAGRSWPICRAERSIITLNQRVLGSSPRCVHHFSPLTTIT